MTDELSPEELAYQRSEGYVWRGKELQPYSFLRKTAAQALVRFFGGNMPEPVLVIWLGLASDAKCKLARRSPESVENEIDEWADRESLYAIRERNGEADLTVDEETARVYRQIMEDITASTSRMVDDGSAEKKKNYGTSDAANYVAMVAAGSCGAIVGESAIIDRLPYARGLQYVTMFRHLRGIDTEPLNAPTLAEERL